MTSIAMKTATSLAAVAALFLITSESNAAGLLDGLLIKDGNESTIQDNSRSQIVDSNLNNVVDEGDIIYGIFRFETVDGADLSTPPQAIYAAFSATVDTITADPLAPLSTLNILFNLKPTAAANPFSLPSLLDDSSQAFADGDAIWDDAIFAVFESESLIVTEPIDDVVNGPVAIMGNFTAADGWSNPVIGGFDPSGTNVNGDADFFMAQLDFSGAFGIDLADGDGISPLTISEIRGSDNGSQIFKEAGGFTLLHSPWVPENILPVALLGLDFALTSHDVILSPNGTIQPSQSEAPNWDMENDANFRINIVSIPEPSTLLLAVVGLLSLGMTRRRRQR